MDNNGGNDINSVVRRADNVLQSQDFFPRAGIIGGYIFICSDISMGEFTRRQVFGMPELYIDSVMAIRPGIPLFLYNFEAHMLYGIYEATSSGGFNIDPTVWPDLRNPGSCTTEADMSGCESGGLSAICTSPWCFENS